ncbi:hypothetical protein CBR_g41354 [Chara braunii]|uniref:Uncharacterized protein n=1 Tax=Chara braunii TaxID=69332 RepID=A0A388LVU0_CHABU|nr:hypothetical protein CBR_g41354 [Chara braunii]|eukprot:GBG86359.1 hypothetical protein CBR_g41354 [Chara braunii]
MSSPEVEEGSSRPPRAMSPGTVALMCDEQDTLFAEPPSPPGAGQSGTSFGGGIEQRFARDGPTSSYTAALYAEQERVVLEEFCTCLKKIIQVGKKRAAKLPLDHSKMDYANAAVLCGGHASGSLGVMASADVQGNGGFHMQNHAPAMALSLQSPFMVPIASAGHVPVPMPGSALQPYPPAGAGGASATAPGGMVGVPGAVTGQNHLAMAPISSQMQMPGIVVGLGLGGGGRGIVALRSGMSTNNDKMMQLNLTATAQL